MRGDRKRDSTAIRDAKVHALYREIISGLGELGQEVPRKYIYGKIQDETGLCFKTIAYILNHTRN